MTSRSKKEEVFDPTAMTLQCFGNVREMVDEMEGAIKEHGFIPVDLVAQFSSSAHELCWMAGAAEAVLIMCRTAEEASKAPQIIV